MHGRHLPLLEFAVMNILPLEKSFELGAVVEVTHGPFAGVRGELIRIENDKAVIRLEECKGVCLVAELKNIAAMK